jgi:peptidoglycan/LPS O-acetylase OafA/YrhL
MSSTVVAGSKPTHFEALDGWRGICACFVVLFHVHGNSPLYASALIRNSYLFVDFFFVLSGFVIALNYASRLHSREGVKRFLILRFGRLYPLHVFVLFCFLAYETAKLFAADPGLAQSAFSGETRPIAVLSNLFLVQSLHVHDSLTWNGPSWSISTEFWAYVVFAVLAASLGLRRWMLWIAAVVLPLLLWQLTTTGMDITYDWGLLRCLFGFAIGVACWRIHDLWPGYARGASAPVATLVEFVVVTAVVAFVAFAGANNFSLLAPFLFGIAVLVFAPEAGVLSRALRSAPARWLGKLSYSIYLTHLLVVTLLPHVIKRIVHADLWVPVQLPGGGTVMLFGRDTLEGTLLYAGSLALTLVFSAFTYRWIESPGRDWSRRWAQRTKAETSDKAMSLRA